MRVLIITQYFRPQPLANAEVVGAIAQGLAELGHQVEVVTPAAGGADAPGMRVRQAFGWFAEDRASVRKRALEYLAFSAGAIVGGLRASRPDVVLVPSPPPTLGLVGLLIARLRRARLVYIVEDLYPEVAIATGTIRPGPLLRILGAAMRYLYPRCAAVVMIDPLLVPTISAPGARVVAIRNGIDLSPFEGATRSPDYLRDMGVADGVQVVMYAGNVGRSQDLDSVIDAVAAVGAELVIHGGGAALDDLKARAARRPGVHFSGFRDRSELGRIFASADLHVVPLKADISSASVPSKLLSIFAAGRPAVLTAEPGSAAAAVLEESGGGWLAPPGDGAELIRVLSEALSDPAELSARGARARQWALEHAGEDRCAREYSRLLEEIVGG